MITEIAKTQIDSPVGMLHIAASKTHLYGLSWNEVEFSKLKVDHEKRAESAEVRFECIDVQCDDPVRIKELGWGALAETIGQLQAYFRGSLKEFSIPTKVFGTDFQRQAWASLQTIPYGQTLSYGQQAKAIGRPKATRAVGSANGKNRIAIIFPCHRVVAANGKLGGFAGGLDAKTWLLQHEKSWAAKLC